MLRQLQVEGAGADAGGDNEQTDGLHTKTLKKKEQWELAGGAHRQHLAILYGAAAGKNVFKGPKRQKL